MKTPSPAADKLLCRILSQIDAIFRPARNPAAPGWASFWQLRKGYLAAGLAWHSEGADVSARKETERLLAELMVGGWVRSTGPKGKVTAVRLSTRGEARARRLCKLPSRALSLAMLGELWKFHAELGGVANAGTDEGEWLPETLCCRCEWGAAGFGDAAWELELFALPSLVAGFIESNSSALGHVYFRFTPAGTAVAEARRGIATAMRRGWRCSNPAETYMEIRTRFKTAIEMAGSADRDIGAIPIPLNGFTEKFAAQYAAKMTALKAGTLAPTAAE